jgi:ribosomal 50S subunit-associated protein YjgA (DUF615 family)
MHSDDQADAVRLHRIQQLCAQLTELVTSSAEQRRALDELLAEALALAERIKRARLTVSTVRHPHETP